MMMIMMMIILMRIMATLGKGSFLNVQTLIAKKKNNNLLDNLPVTSPLPSASSWPHFYRLFDNFF